MGGISVFILLGFLSSMYILFLLIFAGIILYLLINYIFEGTMLYTVAKRENTAQRIQVWIPCWNKTLLGDSAGKLRQGRILAAIDLLILLGVLSMCFTGSLLEQISGVVLLAVLVMAVVSFILNIYLAHHIYKKVTPKLADILTLVSVFTVGFGRPVILFIIRNHENLIGDEPEKKR
ncbi:MAG: hypothetical protein U0M21_03575 [Emergencia sp.]|nr:hypothetical protein [Emergencia sp.]